MATGDDGFDYIRRYYQVPARIGGRIRYTGEPSGEAIDGTIVGTKGQYLLAEMDRPRDVPGPRPKLMVFHPTWEIEYLDVDQPRPLA